MPSSRAHFRLALSIALMPLGVSLTIGACSSVDSRSNVAAEADARVEAAAPDARASEAAAGDAGNADVRVDAGSCKLAKPYSTKNKTCNDCAATECCSEVNGCLDDVECDDHYVNCILACALLPDDAGPDASAGIAACESDCANSYALGRAAYDRAIGCVDQKCAGPCGT